jgi:mono/diheme cytochrome c family protein
MHKTLWAATAMVLASVLSTGALHAQASDEAARGEELYASFCSSCHGQYGRGDGALVESISVRPPDFTDPGWLAGRTPEQILEGLRAAPHARMAVASLLEEDKLGDAIAYVTTLSVPGQHVSVPAGRDIYNASCWVCHGSAGDGRGPAADKLDGATPRDFTSAEFVVAGREDEVVEVITQGAAAAFHGSPYMVEWSTRLSPQQIRDVVAYLHTFKTR